jgi:hypothetical protein
MNTVGKIFLAAVPDPGAGEIPAAITTHVDTLLRWAAGLALAACVALLIYNFVKMGMAKHSGQQADVSGVFMTIIAAIGVVCAGGLIGAAIA